MRWASKGDEEKPKKYPERRRERNVNATSPPPGAAPTAVVRARTRVSRKRIFGINPRNDLSLDRPRTREKQTRDNNNYAVSASTSEQITRTRRIYTYVVVVCRVPFTLTCRSRRIRD